MSTPSTSIDQARQSVAYLNQFVEKLREQKDVNVLNIYNYQEVANLHVSMARLNNYFTGDQPVTSAQPAQPVPVSQAQPVQQPQRLQAPAQQPQMHTI